jgi:molecular chaperone GrpE
MSEEKNITQFVSDNENNKKSIVYTKKKDKELKKRLEEIEHKYKRALADYQNLLKRTTIEKREFTKFANEQMLVEILPVFDNLKMSLTHADKEASKNGWLEGIRHVVKQFRGVLNDFGIEEIKTVGERFDHNTMDAIAGKGEKVKKEIKPGYKLNGKVIIPAKVILE